MSQGVASPSTQFDLNDLSAKLWPFTSRKRKILIGTEVFLVAFVLLFLVGDAPSIASRTLPPLQAIDLVIVLAGVALIMAMTIPSILKLKRGATLLSIDDLGFDLRYPDGTWIRTLWSSRKLDFQLIDLSHVDPSKLRAGQPYSISVHGVRSLLTMEAYQCVIDQVKLRNLEDSVVSGSRWIYSADASPFFHRIHAGHRDGIAHGQAGNQRGT
jgi:hypothetical protein